MPRGRTTTPAPAPVDAARAAVESSRKTLADWETRLDEARAELTRLEATSGEVVLDDPGAIEELPRQMQKQRDLIAAAEHAIKAQHVRVRSAESTYVNAEADVLEQPLAALRARLDQHQAKTAELLASLEEHEGKFVPEPWLITEQLSNENTTGGARSWVTHKSEALIGAVDRAAKQVEIARQWAAGEEPVVASREDYPRFMWGPDALVPAPAYARHSASVATSDANDRASLLVVEQRIVELEAAIQRGDSETGGLQDWTLASPPTRAEQLEGAQRQAAHLRERLGTTTTAPAAAESVTVQ